MRVFSQADLQWSIDSYSLLRWTQGNLRGYFHHSSAGLNSSRVISNRVIANHLYGLGGCATSSPATVVFCIVVVLLKPRQIANGVGIATAK
jgi:hypothetical protein